VAADPRVREKELRNICVEQSAKSSQSREERSGSGPLDPEGHVARSVFQRKGTPEERGEQEWEELLKARV
jgi:hypothetical protein